MGDRQRKGLFGLISSGIGMAAEYTYADAASSSGRTLEAEPSASDEKRRSVGPSDLTDPESFSSDDESTEDDEEIWELDDAITSEDSKDGLPSYEESEATKQLEPTEDLVKDVMSTSAAHEVAQPSSSRPQNPLPCPVIIPQRRPRKKSRGFVQAYAPVLQNAGIDQATFLTFLKNFHKSSQAHPILPIIQVAAGIAGFAPGVIALAVTTGVQIAARVAAETQERYKTNTFLDKMNQELFQPAGLYAMIVKYKSDAEMEDSARRTGLISNLIKPQTVDLSTNQVIAKYSGEDSSAGMSSRMQNLRISSTTSSGQLSLPECAPLVFPAIDEKFNSSTGPETFKDKTKDAQRFLSDYLDRRAQMQYAAQGSNPEQLTVPQGERGFKSSLADPNHAMHSGGLVALVSGGKLTPRRDKRERKMERREEKIMTMVTAQNSVTVVEALGEAEQDLDMAEAALMAVVVAVEDLELLKEEASAAVPATMTTIGVKLLVKKQSMVMMLQGRARLLTQMRTNADPDEEGGIGVRGVAVVRDAELAEARDELARAKGLTG
ncbi:uncharacterized protein MYCFIDRAFT_193207 [Pseudocercospora fijiensis CIRAD86]|uniref:Uncharacterized protein n=1 Tax=Pseudocercospora fijiensis (strain CIRAD86) TaxID=383855 RepID=N1Q8M0_PSEFD|nr:uncharacterized protein MYCFIDRAFT_193207 [Pseudocercospora fijiensis CIRAD86]EME89240.1 hypothetical protein MYCFIDRAFT_193207 [Pseudocercospora fijiensis CIRAD86]